MKITEILPLLSSLVPLLGLGVDAFPLHFSLRPRQVSPTYLTTKWLQAYNKTLGDCPSYLGHGLEDKSAAPCVSWCADQHENRTGVQPTCVGPDLTEEEANEHGQLYRDPEGNAWSLGKCHCDNVTTRYTLEKSQDNETATVKTPVPQKTVLNIMRYPYSYVEKSAGFEDGWNKWAIDPGALSDGSALDTFGFQPGNGQITIFEAWNSFDKRGRDRLKLRDILLAWWYDQTGMAVSSINSVYIRAVIEQTTDDAIANAYKLMKKNRYQDLTLYPGTDDEAMEAAFLGLQTESKFGTGMDLMLKEYSDSVFKGRIITSFTMTRRRASNLQDLIITWG